MKRTLLSAVALVGLTALSAKAADMPVAAPVAVAPAWTWTGYHVGFNVGVAWLHDRDRDDGFFGPSTLTIPTGAGGPGSNFLFTPSTGGLGAPGVPIGFVTPLAGVPLPPPGTVIPLNNGFNSFCTFDCGRRRTTGIEFGAAIGYNYQFGVGQGLVIGFESDIQMVNLHHTRDDLVSGPGFAAFPGGTITVTTPAVIGTPPYPLFGTVPGQAGPNTFTFFDPRAPFTDRGGPEWYGTIRGKVGYAWNRFLVYGTGGFAYGEGGKNIANFVVPTHVGNFSVYNQSCAQIGICESSSLRTGWVAGGGFEWAFWNNFSLKLEAMYVRLRRDDNNGTNFLFNAELPYAVASGPGFPGSPYTIFYAPASAFSFRPASHRRDDSFIVARVGIDYKFDFAAPPAPAPVVAKY